MDQKATDFKRIFGTMMAAKVDAIVIGGAAANLLGSPRYTLDVDIVYERTRENMQRIVEWLTSFHPYLRGAPPGLPFHLDLRTLKMGLNFTLVTDLGNIDILAEVLGGGRYEDLLPFSEIRPAYGFNLRCIKLDKLIEIKRASGRTKDFEGIAELEIVRQEETRPQ
jgi:hypothetical protein